MELTTFASPKYLCVPKKTTGWAPFPLPLPPNPPLAPQKPLTTAPPACQHWAGLCQSPSVEHSQAQCLKEQVQVSSQAASTTDDSLADAQGSTNLYATQPKGHKGGGQGGQVGGASVSGLTQALPQTVEPQPHNTLVKTRKSTTSVAP